jgi:hypothetical protein
MYGHNFLPNQVLTYFNVICFSFILFSSQIIPFYEHRILFRSDPIFVHFILFLLQIHHPHYGHNF